MSKRVLIVDDEDNIREVTQLSLEAVGGWDVVPVSSGKEAIELASSDSFDAILMDVMMPGMDGPTTFERLQQIPGAAGIPVILLTAKIQPADKARFESLGVAGVISKPYDPMTLSQQVSDILGWS